MRLRPVEDILGAADLFDAAIVHDNDLVCQRQRFILGVRDMNEGNSQLTLQPLEFRAHAQTQERIKRGQRLIEQQDRGIGNEGAGKRHTLLLST